MFDIASFRKASLIALTVILFGWSLESVVMVFGFGEYSIIEQFVSPSGHDVWMRIPPALLTIAIVFSARYFIIRQRKTIVHLENALSEVKTLSALLPICAWCKKIRNDKGYWTEVESYLGEHAGTEFTHGICPECLEER